MGFRSRFIAGLGWRAATEFLVACYDEAVRRHRSRRPTPRHPSD